MRDIPPKDLRKLLVVIVLAAVALRLGARVIRGEEYFWKNGYYFYYETARNLTTGKGLCIGSEVYRHCAQRTPLYPLFLALATLGGRSYWPIILAQAAFGAGTALCAFLIGRELFDQKTGLLASLLTAVYPYYVFHDTALQETGLFTFLTTLSTFLLLRTSNTNSRLTPALAGLAMGAAVLTRPALAPFAVVALMWTGLFGGKTAQEKCSKAALMLAPLALIVGLWLARNYVVVGEPVLTSEAGRVLWDSNNPYTFSHYPADSMDRSEMEAIDRMPPAERAEMEKLFNHEIELDRWFGRKGWEFIRAHPALTVRAAVRKVAAAFSWTMNPARSPVVQAVYSLSYVPVMALGLAGMFLRFRQWKIDSIFYVHFLSFALLSAIYYAHTSHRTYLDVYLIIFSAQVIHAAARLRYRRSSERGAGSQKR